MEGSSDSFEYILQLTKALSTQCRESRQETDRIESLLRRLSKQTQISFDHFSKEPNDQVRADFEKLSQETETEAERLIKENFSLIYKIEQQEYINQKVWTLIDQVDELLNSIKNFVIEQKVNRPKMEHEFFRSVLKGKMDSIELNIEDLRRSSAYSRGKLDTLVEELQHICEEIEWDRIPKDSREYKTLLNRISYAEQKYQIKITP